jgi:hypothetical protein
VKSSAVKQVVKYSYNNIVSTVTYRVIKKILRFNVLQFKKKIGLNYKVVVILIIIIV